jgi:hypothetical protein
MKTSSFIFRTLPVAALLLALTACSKFTHIATNAAGHSISAEIEGDHSIDSQTNRAVISCQFGKITIERARVRLEDGPWTAIPQEVPVTVGIARHKRWVTAGSVAIKETSR